MKSLNGRELADYIEERQAKQVRALRQAHHVEPKLAIVQTVDNPVIDSYVALKKRYGADILVDVEAYKIDQADLMATIQRLNEDASVHGIIIQLPLQDESATEEAVNTVVPEKDVDGLGQNAQRDPATALAINWLVAGYNVTLVGKKIAIVGNGRLVGAPLSKMWQESGFDVTVFDKSHTDMLEKLREFDVIVTAAGAPALITSKSVKIGAVVIDAGTAAEHGKIVGDVAGDVRTRDDLTITPEKGGVGPLTVTALFDNVIQSALATATR
jgi:methylenetetrahydrofolate dehydrogenase (NADP+) / methenyltetrahydrofolate cyclohydrolase